MWAQPNYEAKYQAVQNVCRPNPEIYMLGVRMHRDHEVFLQALHGKQKIMLFFFSKEDGTILTRTLDLPHFHRQEDKGKRVLRLLLIRSFRLYVKGQRDYSIPWS